MLCFFALLTLLACCYATPPPGYVKQPDVDKYPPKYEYGYTIQDNKGSGQGKLESREGVFSLGSYFVQLGAGPNGANQNVQYITDEWGYHPLVEYSSTGDHSQTRTQFALGEKAVEALKKHTNSQTPKNKVQPQPVIINPTKQAPAPNSVPEIPIPLPTASTTLPRIHHPNQENVPNLQNVIPVQYIYQPINVPQAQYIMQPQNVESLPQPQFLIQDPNFPQQYLIPVFEPNSNLQNQQIFINEADLNQNQVQNVQTTIQVKENVSNPPQQKVNKLDKSMSKPTDQNNEDHSDVEYIAQAIQKELNLQYSESLSKKGNDASKENSINNEPNFDEMILKYEHSGGYGSKIKLKQPSAEKIAHDFSSNLIDRTRNLVSGLDVLNINDAVTSYVSSSQAEYDQNKSVKYNENEPTSILEAVSNKNKNSKQNELDLSNDNQISNQQNNLIASSSSYSSNVNAIHNSRTKLLEILNSEKVNVEKQKQSQHISFEDQPIIVAELDNYEDNKIQSITENYREESNVSESIISTTQQSIEANIKEENVSTQLPILITPRPVSNNFLAPITAAVSLQSAADIENSKQGNFVSETSVEIQKSVPYYLGKIEFFENQQQTGFAQADEEKTISTKLVIQKEQREENDKEKNLQELQESNNYPQALPLIQINNLNNLNAPDQVSQQGQNQQEDASSAEYSSFGEKESKVVNKPTEITKYSYPVPVEVTKVVEKPIHITKIVEKPVPVHVPQPYPVERIVEKQVKVPVEVTKYIDNPIPVHIPVPQPVAVPVEVERFVQTVVKEPYPVEVPVAVEVPVQVPVPHPVQVTKYIEKPYPVEKIVEKPIHIEKIVEKPVTKYVEKPYPVHVRVPVPHPIAIPIEVPQSYPVEVPKFLEKPYALPQIFPPLISKPTNPLTNQQPLQAHSITKLVQVEAPKYFDKQVPLIVNVQKQQKQNPYLYAPQYQIDWKNFAQCDLFQKQNHPHRFAKNQDYIGLVPPLQKPAIIYDFGPGNQNYRRKARNSFGQNLRIEYGFKPPIIPSVQTDEFGMPLNKEE